MDVKFTKSEIAKASREAGLVPEGLTKDEEQVLRDFTRPLVGHAAVNILTIGLYVIRCTRELIDKVKPNGH